MLKLAQLMAKEEGYGAAGAIPTVRNNPLDLRHSPHSSHDGIGKDAIGIIDCVEHGWEDAERQLRIVAERYPGITIAELIAGQRDSAGAVLPGGYPGWAPRDDGNDPARYAAHLCSGLSVDPDTPLTQCLEVEA
jgi:hypothetical protein